MNQQKAAQLASSQDWSGFRLGDLSEALRSLVILTLKGPVDQATTEYWRGRCDAEIDFLLYSFALVDVAGAHDDPTKDAAELVGHWAALPLTVTSRGNLLRVYLNIYFFKHIASVELPKLQVAMSNPGFSQEQCIDFYITHLLYVEVVEENPGVFFTYEQIPGVDPSRVAALHQNRDELATSLKQVGIDRLPTLIESLKSPFGLISDDDAQKLVPVFRSLFLLMTYFAGSNYRRVHDAVTTLFSIDMADFRNAYFQNLPSIVQHRGALVPQVSLEATLAETKGNSQPVQQKPTIPPPSAAATKSGGCYVATAVYGSYDCPQVWVLRRFRDRSLARSSPGRAFIRTYYATSPIVLRLLGRRGGRLFQHPTTALVRVLKKRGYSDAPYVDEVRLRLGSESVGGPHDSALRMT